MKRLSIALIAASLLLTGCSLPQNKAMYGDIQRLKKEIRDFQPSSKILIPLKETVELAEVYQKIGEPNEAIKLYNYILKKGKSAAVINNLGRLYEQVGETEKAVAQYTRLIEEYYENEYLYDITWAYIRAGNRKQAQKYFNAWQQQFHKTDEQTQQAIQKLANAKE